MKSALIDLAALECLDAFPRDLDRLLVVIQISPWRREALHRTFPGAEIVEAWPPGNGPWQDTVENALAGLPVTGVTMHGVPLLDCFREAWRRELEQITVVDQLGNGECCVAAGSSWEAVLGGIVRQCPRIQPRVVGRRSAVASALAGKLRAVSTRGLRLALASRLDPSGLRRAAFARPCQAVNVECLTVSSYANTTRAALRLWRELGAGRALFVETGPGAAAGVALPSEWTRTTVPALLPADRQWVRKEIARRRGEAAQALNGWNFAAATGSSVSVWPLLDSSMFGSRFAGVHLPEAIATVAALRHALEDTGARLVITGNEFSFCDRAALLLGRAMGVRTEAVQHGVIDGHYRHDRVLADRYWCWNRAARELMVEWGASGGERLATLSDEPSSGSPFPAAKSRQTLVLFTQPYELIPLRRDDLLDEVIPVLDQVSKARGWPVVVKIHPLESVAPYKSRLRGLPHWRIVATESVDSILASARAAIVLDSSVVVDSRCRDLPCFGIGWYDGHYGADLEAMGYLRRASNPAALAAALSGVA